MMSIQNLCAPNQGGEYIDDDRPKSGMNMWDDIARPILFMCSFHILRAMGCFF